MGRQANGDGAGSAAVVGAGAAAAPELMRRATIKDVAVAAGVSRSTASRALTGRGYVATDVRERVLAAAENLRYVPDATARYLKQQVSLSLGVLVSDLRNSFYARLAAGVGQAARTQGYSLVLAEDGGSAEAQVEAAETFVATRVAGVVVTPVSADVTTYLSRHRIPVVEIDRQFAAGDCDAVVVDNQGASQQVIEHLVGLGHRRIALFIDETTWTTGRDRHAGYQTALAAAGIALDPDLVVSSGWDVDAARAAARALLGPDERPTAVFAANNVLAEGVWRAANDLGLSIPDDVSLVSFDDAPWMSLVTPGLTAVAQDEAALGETAVRRLLDRIAEPDAAPVTVEVSTTFVERASTRRLPA
ncbi:substrate-binding domain-containing protein [Jiangella mangrovi]|uniref:DNA-binding LacI/PurR family transcriptional regulator n=1 Tax=Jiangella mangrovi TaxID=1524084 RepID=A0A7W9LKL1_9ACTN|nr:DNA-binding LacI/PurR family transcriptional regulator [Jiangella mangrovi]